MNIPVSHPGPSAYAARARDIEFDAHRMTVHLVDGRSISVPLEWYPRLADATPAQRERWQLAGAGEGIHWPEVDEDLSIEGLLRGHRAPRRKSPAA